MEHLSQRPARRLRPASLAFATLVALALSAGVAVASSDHQKYLAPPGNPAVSQYLEVVPNAMGSAPPRSGGNPPPSSGAGSSNPLSPAEQKKLDHLGPDGKTLASVVEATAPPAAETNGGTAGGRSGSGDGKSSSGGTNQSGATDPGSRTSQDSLSSTGSQSAVSAVLGAAAGQGGGGGMGILLPALMAAGVLSLVFAVLRRRGARRP